MAQLILNQVYKKYDGKKKKLFKKQEKNNFAVNGISYTCNDGEFIGILGPSGCGKSTTLRMIAGLEKITAGEIYIGDMLINDLEPKDRNIGLAFEDYALYPPLTVRENLAFNMRAKKKAQNEIDEAIAYVAPLMKIDDLLEMKPSALSGGQKQRVNIARAIVRRPGLLLLDEPLSHLDGKMRQQLRQEIRRMHHEIHCTAIIVTHDQMEAMSLADRIIIMKDGMIQQIGTPLEVYDDPVNEFVAGFIGEPPMNLLHAKIVNKNGGFVFTFAGSELEVQVPKKYGKIVCGGMEVILGVRPTDVMITKKSAAGTQVRIAVYENLGDERRIAVRVGASLVSITTVDDVFYSVGDKVQLAFHEERTHLFDPATGNRIRG